MAEFLGTRRNGTVYFKFILFYSHQWPFCKNSDIIPIKWKFWLFLANFCKMAEFLATRRIGTIYFLFILFYARQWAFHRNGEIIPTKWKFCLFLHFHLLKILEVVSQPVNTSKTSTKSYALITNNFTETIMSLTFSVFRLVS